MVIGLQLDSDVKPDPICEPCLAGKMHANPFPSHSRFSNPLELIHSDLHGPLLVSSHSGMQYFISFIDDATSRKAVCTLRLKSQAFEAFTRYKAYAENATGFKMKSTQDDKVAFASVFLGRSFLCFVHVWNRLSTSTIKGITPYEAWDGAKLNKDKRGGLGSHMGKWREIDADEWQKAAQEEMDAHARNGTLDIVLLLLVTKQSVLVGFSRSNETQTALWSATRLALLPKASIGVLVLIVSKPLLLLPNSPPFAPFLLSLRLKTSNLRSVNISHPFINGELDTKVYMEQPERFERGEPDHVCLLRKGLYGLKQASRLWYQKLKGMLGWMDFKHIYSDNSLHVCKDLRQNHCTTHLYLLLDRPNRRLSLSQCQYIIDMLERYGFDDSSPVKMPILPGVRLSSDMSAKSDEDKEYMKKVPYISASRWWKVYQWICVSHRYRCCQLEFQASGTRCAVEAEFIFVVEAGREIVWMRHLLSECYQCGEEPRASWEEKHLDLRFFWLHDQVKAGVIQVLYIPTEEMVADVLTKAVPSEKVDVCRKLMGLEG
ncbi:hypothetical protein EW146_g3316 [Bondarzewia mesenterica]|uniref:Reverse transcriptase Ty1/copia-type domain-containing protein n=1 Tax=Bondarzewia mesenterica TaxID=1095465 RepID=A0A4S4LZD3_9AGAM|nr:hypothetical protein EW146_g3316 [Bondarzewia mesenterica]